MNIAAWTCNMLYCSMVLRTAACKPFINSTLLARAIAPDQLHAYCSEQVCNHAAISTSRRVQASLDSLPAHTTYTSCLASNTREPQAAA